MKQFLQQFLSEGGKVSSKRVIFLALFMLISIEVLVELFTNLEVSKNTHDTLMYSFDVVVASIVAAKFVSKSKVKENEDKQIRESE